MFSVRVYLINAYLVCLDLAVPAASYVAVKWQNGIAGGGAMRGFATQDEFRGLALVLGLWLALSFYFGMYRSRRMDSPFADFVVVVKVAFASWILVQAATAAFPALLPAGFASFRILALSALALIVARWVLRVVLHELRRRGHDVKNLVLVGSRDSCGRISEKIDQRAHYGYRVIRQFVYPGQGDDGAFLDQIRGYIQSQRVDDVILALPAHVNPLAAQVVSACESQGVSVRIVPDLLPLIQADTQIYNLDGIPLVNARLYPTEYFGYVVLKRVFDLLASVLVLTILSPLFLLLALLVRLTSPGPVFFSQERIGMNGRRFRILKFRTMRPTPSLDPDSHWTVKDDRNVTPFGRWLRRSNLDELPQFLNVLRGDMSIVGPRPERPFFLDRFRREVPEYMARHYVKSGITGWAQVNGWRGDTAITQRVAHDLYYIRNWTVAFDIKILSLTLARAFFPASASPIQGEGQGEP